MKAMLPMILLALVTFPDAAEAQDDPPAINPFSQPDQTREDALPGCVALSDGTVHPGKLYLTRDLRLKIYDQQLKRQREVPLRVVASIECEVDKQWMEKEWRFKANADNEKVYTGRSYPARQYTHTITLADGRKITGSLSGIVYVDPYGGGKKVRFLLHKRQKGDWGSSLDQLVYVQKIQLGEAAMRAGVAGKERQEEEKSVPR
jgi:hypothetical protein